jgi:hypothetical protein
MEILFFILGLIMISLSAISESIMDKIQFHYDKSIFSTEKYNQLFWNPIESWKNKWKDDLKTEKFLGSSTIFVFTTDAWHLFKFFKNTFLFIGLPLLCLGGINIILSVIIARVLYGLTFTLYFDILLKK